MNKSFFIYGTHLDIKYGMDYKKEKENLYKNLYLWKKSINENYYIDIEIYNNDNEYGDDIIAIGTCPTKSKDDETFKAFKERIERTIKDFLKEMYKGDEISILGSFGWIGDND